MKTKIYVMLVTLFFSCFLQGQIRFSETIQDSKIASPNDNTLYFIDFWATWCAPCVYANEYLEVLQRQYPDEFYVVSLSEEVPEKVKRHIEKHPTDLAVAIDYQGENFDAHSVKILPYGILVDTRGNVLWKGSPTDFKSADLESFLKRYKVQKPYHKVFKIKSVKEDFKSDYVPSKDFEISKIKQFNNDILEISNKGDFTHFKGDLQSILAYGFKVLKNQVYLPKDLNQPYEIYFKDSASFLSNVTDALKLNVSTFQNKGEVLVVDNDEPKLWDKNQIDWGQGALNYLIDDNQIQADNMTFKDFLYHLSHSLNLPISTTTVVDSETLHDWQVHYRFYGLMQNDLLDNFGLKVEKKTADFMIYNVTKKAP
ncbi:TlpA family protein disulfide reductase [Psychroserpens sp. XS_ASV72]|uniref:TlpA family protein disulfide reductase n=1 Tax=Psychroserpens sp. XS_ASV72 TaxID=3241293 RepID=UPI0035136237